ncbi:MAG: DNRLRE domain-containing protein [Candidatus Eisenbacteria sp.]|nr:DNRLRE domain-containing protein [Candidatus Eisenbacteria bacterium]
MMPRRIRSLVKIGLWLLMAAWVSSCSETQRPLEWEEAVRGGLDASPITVDADTLVVASASYHEPVWTGISSYFLVGHLEQSNLALGAITAQAYLKWDVSDLPEGEILSAHLEFVLRDYERTPSEGPDLFNLELFAVTDSWCEDSLGIAAPASYGTQVGRSGSIDVTNMPGFPDFPESTDAVLSANDFILAELPALVDQWRGDESANNGLVIVPARTDPGEGFLRFVSSEGDPRDQTTEISTPALVVEIAAADGDTIITLEATEDGYAVFAEDEDLGASLCLGDDEDLILSAGYARRIILALDLSDPQVFPPGIAVHQAVLQLTVEPDADWILDPDKELTVRVHESDAVWSEGDLPETIEIDVESISSAVLTGDSTTVELDILDPVQKMLEGSDVSLVLRCALEPDFFRTLLVKGRCAADGRPRVRIVYTCPGTGRLGPWPEEE